MHIEEFLIFVEGSDFQNLCINYYPCCLSSMGLSVDIEKFKNFHLQSFDLKFLRRLKLLHCRTNFKLSLCISCTQLNWRMLWQRTCSLYRKSVDEERLAGE